MSERASLLESLPQSEDAYADRLWLRVLMRFGGAPTANPVVVKFTVKE